MPAGSLRCVPAAGGGDGDDQADRADHQAAEAEEPTDEVWLRRGSVVDAARASIALPGLFTPVWHEGRLLVDGGLVNPVPVSLVRALGADIVIAVDLNSDILQHHLQPLELQPAEVQELPEGDVPDGSNAVDSAEGDWMERLRGWVQQRRGAQPPPPLPSVLDVVMTSVNIMQMRITRSRMRS